MRRKFLQPSKTHTTGSQFQGFSFFLKKTNASLNGFTLIELLVSIGIIAIILSITIPSFNDTKTKSENAKRLADVNTIQKSLELYMNDHLEYPDDNAPPGEDFEKSKNGDGFIEPLKNGGYVNSEVPVDPINANERYYVYAKFSKGDFGCDKSDFYVLGIKNMDSIPRPHPESPSWHCPDRNFQSEFDWVTGRYQH